MGLATLAITLMAHIPCTASAQDSATTHSDETTPATPFPYVELGRKTVQIKDYTVTLIRVRPPQLPKAPPAPLPQPLTAEQQSRIEELEKKTHATLNITATVYLYGKQMITELRWRSEDTGNLEYVVYSNADFRYLTQLHNLETETTVYSWFPFVSAYSLADWTEEPGARFPIPVGLTFSSTEAEYLVDSRAKDVSGQETTLAGLDYLHAYYQLNYKDLRSAYEKREAENAARKEELRKTRRRPRMRLCVGGPCPASRANPPNAKPTNQSETSYHA